MNKKNFFYSLGIVIIAFLVVVTVVQAISLSNLEEKLAHNDSRDNNLSFGNNDMMDMTSDMMSMMHSRKNMIERMAEMDIEEMDKDGDGKCDMCEMDVDDCLKMMKMHLSGDFNHYNCPMHQ